MSEIDNVAKSESAPMNIATISAGFEKGDFLVREEQGNRVYFDFFEEVSMFSVSLVNGNAIGVHDVDDVFSVPDFACTSLDTGNFF